MTGSAYHASMRACRACHMAARPAHTMSASQLSMTIQSSTRTVSDAVISASDLLTCHGFVTCDSIGRSFH